MIDPRQDFYGWVIREDDGTERYVQVDLTEPDPTYDPFEQEPS